MNSECDFPAAHSMDTTWFAADRDGQIACFESGEAGAVPTGAARDQCDAEQYKVLEELTMLPPTEEVFDLAGRLFLNGQEALPAYLREALDQHRDLLNMVIFVRSLDAVRDRISQGLAAEVKAASGFAAWCPTLPYALLQHLVDDGQWLGGFWQYVSEEPESWLATARWGQFVYRHCDECENWISGPYGRREIPSIPIHIDQLSPSLRELIAPVTFRDLSFRDSPLLQPIDHFFCESWQHECMAIDGVTRRTIPGKEDELRRFRQATTPWWQRLMFWRRQP